MKFASELPYPEVEKQDCLSEAKMLMPSYAGLGGELTAITTYCFQSYISDPRLKPALVAIARVEMTHFSLLGNAIYRLGGYPIIGSRSYWNGSMANYTLSPKKFLAQNIESEKAAISIYERTILNLKSDSAKLLLERIILDEELHIKDFEELLGDIQ